MNVMKVTELELNIARFILFHIRLVRLHSTNPIISQSIIQLTHNI